MRRWMAPGILWSLLSAPASAVGQDVFLAPAGELDDYWRLLEVLGKAADPPILFRSPSTASGRAVARGGVDHLWSDHFGSLGERPSGFAARLFAPEIRAVYNSAFPSGINDGPLWTGRGAAVALSAGAEARWGPLTLTLNPTAWYAQNRAFDLVPVEPADRSPFAYPWRATIDWPQRFGDAPLWKLDPGQSGLRMDWRHFTIGMSTESMWWGPAVRYPIIMSTNAPGFPHLDAGIRTPVSVGIGQFETRAVWGRLAESEFFDGDPDNDHRLFVGLVAAIQPKWLPGLTLGVTRVFYQTWTDSLGVRDFLPIFETVFKFSRISPENPEGEDVVDQMLSLSARWTLPESGFEAYVEWGRNDHNGDLRDFVLQPDHSEGITLGFQKAFPAASSVSRLRGEITRLGQSQTVRSRATPSYYAHHVVRQGYTHEGQIIGAGTGPGSNAQYLAFDQYRRSGRWGIALERVRFDDDVFYTQFAPVTGVRGPWAEVGITGSATRFLGVVEVGGALTVTRQLNRNFVVDNDRTNLRMSIRGRWHAR